MYYMDEESNRGIVDKANEIVLKITKAMPDFVKIDQANNFQAAKRARKIVMQIEKKDILELKQKIKDARVAREYNK